MGNDIIVNARNMAKLTQKAFIDSLFKEGEDTTNHVKVEGITCTFIFHPQRLEEKRELVAAILAQLPEEFKDGGWTFLNLFITKDYQLWTDTHRICEYLVVMAIGLGLMEYCLPREVWKVLPGGVPYLAIK